MTLPAAKRTIFGYVFLGACADEMMDSTRRSCAISGWMSSTVAGIECREVDWSWKGGLGHS